MTRTAIAFAGRLLRRWWPLIALVAGWQLSLSIGSVSPVIAATPVHVLDVLTAPSWLLGSLLWTLGTTMLGLCSGLALGAVLALVSWWSGFVETLVTPLALVMRTAPIVGFLPVIGSLVGYNGWTVIVVAAIISFFPAFVFVSAGLRKTPAGSDDLLRVLGAQRAMRLRHLALPACVPGLALAVRLSATTAMLGALGAEFLVGNRGLGHLLRETQYNLQTARSWAIGLVVAAFSLLIYSLATRLQHWSQHRFS
jgi:putative hydroxymethylpyrimidine transport system permease protein